MRYYTNKLNYPAVSLVEMLLTMVILSFVMVLSGVVLTTMIRTAGIANARTTIRSDTEFILELLKRNVRNSQPQDIRLFNVKNRYFNEKENKLVFDMTENQDIIDTSYEVPILQSQIGNELQFRPIGSNKWVCIGLFPSNEKESDGSRKGFILKSESNNLVNPQDCFNSSEASNNIIVLNSYDSDVKSLKISFYYGYNGNTIYLIETTVWPLYWVGKKADIRPEYTKQIITSTQKLTWNN